MSEQHNIAEDLDRQINDAYRKKIHEVKLKMLERLQGKGEGTTAGLDIQSMIGLKLLFPEAFGGNEEEPQPSKGIVDEVTKLMLLKGLFPEMFGVEKSKKEEQDEIDKELAKQAKISTLRLMQASAMPFAMGPTGAQLVPALDKDGKPMVDAYGMPLFRASPGAVQPEHSLAKELLLSEKERADKLEEKFLDILKESRDQRVQQLDEEVKALRSRDPVQELIEMADKLKEIGAFKAASPESLEVVKYKTDMQKWMHEQSLQQRRWEKEQEMTFRQWLEEMKQRREEIRHGREQIQELGRTLREGIKEVGKPLAQAVGEGAKEGFKAPKPKGNPPQRSSLAEMSDAQLQEQLLKAQEAQRLVEQAEAQLMQELQRRRQAASSAETASTTASTSSSQKVYEEVKPSHSTKTGAKNIR
ncbi:MAG: hypothetical protein K6T73_03375 [Candidatus Bathyarchaeota archaeon]|nr:hypothetical protein [Candidatus Bathyarchaeota archaeon]